MTRTLTFDLMRGDRFVATMRYPYSPIFKLDLADLHKWILQKRPTLKSEVISLFFDDPAVKSVTFYPKKRNCHD